MIAVVDYGVGNVRSVERALAHVGAQPLLTADADELARADGVVLPGVGAFAPALEKLSATGLGRRIVELAGKGVPILGVTYNPIKREMYWAARGIGCHLNTRRVRVTRTRKLQGATVLASRSETARGEWQVFHGLLKVSPTGSVAYKLAMVAAGKGDATFTRSPKSEWDIASGAALIMEAGGVITDIKGREIRFNQPSVKLEGLIADNRILHRALVKVAPHPRKKA